MEEIFAALLTCPLFAGLEAGALEELLPRLWPIRRRRGRGGAGGGTPVKRGAASEAGGGAAGEAGTLPKWLLKASRPGVGTWLGRLRGLAGVVIGG